MKKIRISLLAATCLAVLSTALAVSAPAKTIIITANDSLRFSVTSITAEPGQTLHVQLHNAGTLPKDVMGHNWILLKADQDPEAYAAAAIGAKADNFEPKTLSSQVLAVVPLLGAGETGDVTFTAPMKPGKYPFLGF
jgi:azurin